MSGVVQAAIRIILYLADAIIFAYLWIVILFFLVFLGNHWFVPDRYHVVYHQGDLIADIVTRAIIYGLGIIELLIVLAILFLINYRLLRLFSDAKAKEIARSIFVVQSLIGSILLIILAFISR